jgi:hypothetical protein
LLAPIAMLACAPAQAQAQAQRNGTVIVTPPKPVVVQPKVVEVKPAALPPSTWSLSRTSVNGLSGAGKGANQPALSGVTALRGFLLSFGNGDHKLRQIGVLPNGRYTDFSWSDSNGDDPFRADASYVTFSGGSMGEVIADGSGKFRIALPTPQQAGHVLVLRGFEFRRADGTDANLRNISVWLDGTRNVAEVSLIDDQGLDFRGLEATLGLVASGGILLPGALEMSTADLSQVAARNISQMVGTQRGYRVRVQYAWIPATLVQQEGALAGGGGDLGKARAATRVDVLQGFEFTFDNSDHHLLTLAVNGDGDAGGNFWFQDNNRDDPLHWTVNYLTLKDAARKGP